MSYEDEIEEDIGGSMVDQLGSGVKFLAKGISDIRITTILRDSEDNPDSLYPAVWLTSVNDIINNGKSFLEAFSDNLLHLNIAVRGGGRSGIIKAEQVKKTGMVQYEAEVPEPGRLDRLLNNEKNQRYEQEQRDKLDI